MWKPSSPSSATLSASVLLIALSYLFMAVSMMLWFAFLWQGSLDLVHLDDRGGEVTKLFLDCALSLAFFVQHSVMVRRPFRRHVLAKIPSEYHGALYSVASGIVLLSAVVFWQESKYVVVATKGIAFLFLRAMFILGFLGMFWAMVALKAFDPFGVDPILVKIGKKNPPRPMPLSQRGPYRYVRHPNYFCCIVLFWSSPYLTLDRLLYNILWTAWVIVGTILEERDLVDDFGEPYRAYQRQVPMLIPWRIDTYLTRAEPTAGEDTLDKKED